MSVIILGIESSCDDTSAAVIKDGVLMSNVIASQKVHEAYGGVVPELASRAHQQNIVPVVSEAIRQAPYKMEVLGQTIDDAAGEAFDKCAKVMGLPYPGGPFIDRLAAEGDAKRFRFSKPHIAGLDYSFSGLKTSFLYTLRDAKAENPNFIEENKADLAASLQKTIIDILMDKFSKAVKQTGIKTIAIGGGVSANSGVRNAVQQYADCHHLKAFIPKRLFTTDNAAMVAVAGYFKYLNKDFCDISLPPFARVTV